MDYYIVEISKDNAKVLQKGSQKGGTVLRRRGFNSWSRGQRPIKNGNMVLTPEARKWIRQYMGAKALSRRSWDKGEGSYWYFYQNWFTHKFVFFFRDKAHATLFKLTWGGE